MNTRPYPTSRTILILDAIQGAGSISDLDDLLPTGANVLRHDAVPQDRRIDQIFVTDHGTTDCLSALREALAYRQRYPNCRVRILRDVERDCSDAEAMVRAVAPRRDAETIGVAASAVAELVQPHCEFEVKSLDGGLLFEFAS